MHHHTQAILLLVCAWILWGETASPRWRQVVNKGEDPDTMDPTALYYALSTIAQCAAALAALIGFLGLWRLDRLQRERDQAEQDLRGLLSWVGGRIGTSALDSLDIALHHIDYIVPLIEALIAKPHDDKVRALVPKADATLKRWRAIPGDQQRVMGVLQRFLRRTLVILALAISGLVVTDALYSWVLTRWLVRLLIIVAGYRLWRDTYAVVREAARTLRAMLILAVLLALASPALAGPVRCLTYEEKSLGRLQTICDDGTRAVSTDNRTLERWDITVTPSPGQRCTGALNPKTKQVEVYCR
jgi:hypothetical protein